MGSAHFQCWGLGFLCLSPLGMGFFLNTTGNGKFFLKRLGLGLRDILLMGMGLYFEWSSPVPLKILHAQRLEIRYFKSLSYSTYLCVRSMISNPFYACAKQMFPSVFKNKYSDIRLSGL